MNAGLWFALLCAGIALAYGHFGKWILAKPTGNERMREIAAAIQEGAKAYLNRQYTTIGMAGIVLLVLIGSISVFHRIGFAIGAVFSGLAGYIGMNISVRANVRTAEAANDGLNAAMQIAFAAAPSPACWWSAWACSAWPATTCCCSPLAWKTRCTRWSAWPSVAR